MSDKNKNKIIRIVLEIYILGVLSITFIVRETMVLRIPDNRKMILEPFREFQAMIDQPNHFFWFMQIFLNILLFVPFGCLLPCVSKHCRNLFITTAAGFLFSSFIETTQYITGRGFTEIDDVINNTLGAFAGYLIFAFASKIYKQLNE